MEVEVVENVSPISDAAKMLHDMDVPPLLRRNYIKTGYRPLNRELQYYVKSAFSWHNEVINIWTHAIPLILLYLFYILPELTYDRPRATVLFTYFGVASVFFCSAMTHLMHSRSPLDHIFWLLVDFSGIGVFSLAIGVQRFLSRPYNSMLFTTFYIPTLTGVVLLQYLTTSGFFVLRPLWKTRHTIRIVCCAIVVFWIYIPLLGRYWEGHEDMTVHTRALQWLVLSGIFMGAHFPECCAPGCFDLVGYGHQLFHICIMLVTWCLCESAHKDCVRRTTGELGIWGDSLTKPLIGVMILACLTCAITTIALVYQAKSQIKEHMNSQRSRASKIEKTK
ncbi:unnamed protein product [Bursaphelenchus xylophilus]|uniref:(pine wood nematode) hypothetical protein n=1 Tax=Bursaphelenchus xylophilus TaxID=6326 RepID=A0A1I7RSA2_BURXY|nr:unnamed protein product [Bursaphelenchus xylophilus]CAG9123092.1 unnamed protein product [Bursaphelenchus xylophilus]